MNVGIVVTNFFGSWNLVPITGTHSMQVQSLPQHCALLQMIDRDLYVVTTTSDASQLACSKVNDMLMPFLGPI